MHADRPRPLVLFAIASGALLAGLGAARGLTLGERSRAEPNAIASSAQAPVVALQAAAPIGEPSELRPSVSDTAPALRGGASSDTAPALRGGASSDTAPALRGGASSDTAPALRGGASVAPDTDVESPESPRSERVAASPRDADRAAAAQASATHEEAVDENAEKAGAESASATRGASAAPADTLQTGTPRADTPQTATPQAATSQPAPPQAAAPQAPAPQAPAPQRNQVRAAPEPSADGVTSQAPTPIHFERRFVAYVRCDGLPLGEGRFPCPRDPRLETQVWRVLAALEACAIAAPARGQGELRLDFKRIGVPALHFEAVEHGPLDLEAVSKCAGPSLSQLHTSLRPDHMVVAFRFELR